MAGFRHKANGGTVTIGPEMEQILDRIADGALRAVRTELASGTEAIASAARSQWFMANGVQRRTGKSGQWSADVVISPGQISGFVQSDDNRVGKRGIPAAFYVHRPRSDSQVEQKVDDAEYAKVSAHYRENGSLPAGYDARIDESGRPTNVVKIVPNPARADGKTLMPALVTRPTKLLAKDLVKRLGPEIAKLSKRGR